MEPFAIWLLKSVVWLTGFALVFILFLRNERFFVLNRIYLTGGVFASLIFPFITLHYTVVLPMVRSIPAKDALPEAFQNAGNSSIPGIETVLLALYFSGVLFILIRLIRQSRLVLRTIRKAEIISVQPVKLLKTSDYAFAFSFFSYVFVNPSITDIETREIVNHELVHIRQKHWFDLVLAELLCMFQWFNPLVWIYVRLIRQNHEYLADKMALQRTSDPAIYKAALLNQIVGVPVVSLANSFNYSVNKKRFQMMKNIVSSPYRKLKTLLILPVFAIVLYSFAKPDYKYIYANEKPVSNETILNNQDKEVKGTVVQQEGQKPLAGAIILISGTSIGTLSDDKGSFTLKNVPGDGTLVVTYVGYESKVIKPDFNSAMTITMVRDTVKFNDSNIPTTPPPPPPPPPADCEDKVSPASRVVMHASAFKVISENGKTPFYVVDGKVVSESEIALIDQNTIESISVLKDKSATILYGEEGKDGVIIITSKNNAGPSQYRYDVNSPASPKPEPLYVVNGRISNKAETDAIDVQTVDNVIVLRSQSAINRYGEKAKYGAVEITTKEGVINIASKNDGAPLILIDGVESKAGGVIDPNIIESLIVLKDESAIAAYGEKGKNGVIEIKTKNAPVVSKPVNP